MDNLREALEEFAAGWEAMTGYNSYVSEELRAILAAHPDNSATEWGVMYEDDLIVKEQDEDSAHLRKAVSIVKNTVIVSRTIGPWQAAK